MINTNLSDAFKPGIKPKEQITILVEAIQNKDLTIEDLFSFYQTAKDPQKGACLSSLAEITQTNPQIVANHIDIIISALSHSANRVKWEAAEIIANIAATYPQQVTSAIPQLQANAQRGGTVVKWASATALTQIALANSDATKQLAKFIQDQSETESNNGVKKIYLNYLKQKQS